ncbi:MAG TPA: ABC transporter permease, partial [Thermoanaerobaculia bacterium]|nr:ABC transporter permease [Thermoanaerobaculia bacterium]
MNDLRHALRLLAKSPGFALVAVLTLAVGLGANTTVMSWIRGILLEPLPGVPDQERVLVMGGKSRSGDDRSWSVPDLRTLQEEWHAAEVVGVDMLTLSLTAGDQPEKVWGSIVTGNFFDALQVPVAPGRGFRKEEDGAPGAHPVVVLSHEFWARRFAADPGMIGKTILLNRHPFTVIGVAASGFQGAQSGLRADLWVPLAMQETVIPGGSRLDSRGSHWMQALARLRPGVTMKQAQAALNGIAADLGREYPDTNDGMRFLLFRFWNAPMGPSMVLMPVLVVLASMAALVLLLACANVANLLLVRALGRRREIAVRSALGAARNRLVRQLLTESLLLAVPAGVLGVVLALGGVRLLKTFVPPVDAPVALAFHLDGRVLALTAALTVLTGLLFGLAPAIQTSPRRIAPVLRDESASTLGGRKGRARSALVVAQIALSCLLLITAGLFFRSLGRGGEIDPGFRTRNALLAAIDLFPNGYDEARGRVFYREALRRLSALPGVESASVAIYLPLDFGGSSSTNLQIDGYVPKPKEEVVVEYNVVGPDYFRTMSIPLVSGRDFGLQDDEKSGCTLAVNETMAGRYWKNRNDALGGRIKLWNEDCTVVAIVKDGKYQQLGEPPRPFFYMPILHMYQASSVIHVRTAGDPLALVPALRSEIREMDPYLPLSAVKSLREHLKISVFAQRLAASFLGAFGLLALVLATVGLYSVIRYAVSQRTREMGVRAALGAQARDITRLVVKEGMVLAAAGLVVGLVAAVGI